MVDVPEDGGIKMHRNLATTQKATCCKPELWKPNFNGDQILKYDNFGFVEAMRNR
jgi:hypothetical protein